jgi:hypothetical protein
MQGMVQIPFPSLYSRDINSNESKKEIRKLFLLEIGEKEK